MTRSERITILLEFYVDVVEGLADRSPGDDDSVLALMCRAWNHPSYRELDRLLPIMRERQSRPYWHLCERYVRYGERRVAWCRRCGVNPAGQIGSVHRHPPGRSVTLLPRIEREVTPRVDPSLVGEALEWLDLNWRGEADIPQDVLACVSERKLRAA